MQHLLENWVKELKQGYLGKHYQIIKIRIKKVRKEGGREEGKDQGAVSGEQLEGKLIRITSHRNECILQILPEFQAAQGGRLDSLS